MSQPRRTIEQLITQKRLPIDQADVAAIHLEVYPSKRTWLAFFDKALLIIGAVALVLSLVFFVAYNWQNLGKIGKFALVEGALVISIALYVALSFRRRFKLIRQLLLLVASVITGSLLALFGQVYQTGADTWQLFFAWAILIIPWVVISRFPALWLLWLGLVNAFLLLYLDVIDLSFVNDSFQSIIQMGILALINFIALNLWLIFLDNRRNINNQVLGSDIDVLNSSNFVSDSSPSDSKTLTNDIVLPAQSGLHWSSYLVGLVSTVTITFLAIITVFDVDIIFATLLSLLLWTGWCAFMYWRFYQRHTDVLMLTYLCFSSIIVVISWVNKVLFSAFWEAGGFLLLALLLIGMSSAAVVWLRKVANENRDIDDIQAVDRGTNHE